MSKESQPQDQTDQEPDFEPVSLLFFDPAQFPDRESVRAFVRSDAFLAYFAAARAALLGADAHEDLADEGGERALRHAREALFFALCDLEELAAVAVQCGLYAGFTADRETQERRPGRLAAIARLAASEANEGAPPERWRPIFEALSEAEHAV